MVTRGDAVAAPTGTAPRRRQRTVRSYLLCALSIFVFLAVPAVAFGNNGNGNGNANGNDAAPAAGPDAQPASASPSTGSSAPAADTSTDPSSAAVAPAAATTPAAPANDSQAAPSNESSANNVHANSSADAATITPQPDAAPPVQANNSPNGNANGQTGSPGNSANAPGHNDPPGNSGIAPPSLGSGPGNSDHTGNANANANSSQDTPKNVNVDVRVGQPGDNGAVVQGNNSNAAAAAGASGGSSGSGAPQQTAAGSGGSATSDTAPNGSPALAPSQADSTGGETIPNANSPPTGACASDPTTTGSAASATTASSGASSPTVSNISPSASCVNGQSSGAGAGANGSANGATQPEATDVTAGSDSNSTPAGPEATDVTVDGTNGDGTSDDGTTVTVGDDTDGTADTPSTPTVVITAPTPTSSSSTDSATATATSSQVDPANINTSVRVDSPGNNGAVYQTNTSTATAVAGASGPGSGSQSSTPTATSTQVTPVNVSVSVRVGSPGDNAPVTQGNTSTATAGHVDPSQIDAALIDLPADGPNSSGDIENVSSVVQDLAQCPDGTPCVPPAGSSAGSIGSGSSAVDNSTATATLQAPSNVSVSIRVASPGTDGLVTQVNDANATGATSVTTLTDEDNLALAIVIPGLPSSIVIPTDAATPWNWNWNWTTGTAPTDPGATPTSTPDWGWNWTAPAAGTTTTTPPASTGTPGLWTWTWTWTRGDWSVTWTYQQACACSWTWNWNWVWPAAGPTAPSAPSSMPLPPPPANPKVSQTNDATAVAAAVTSFDGSQDMTISSEGEATQYQGITSDQSAIASADASQVAPLNRVIRTAGKIKGIKQVNHVAAASTAAAFDTATQKLEQRQTATDDGAVHSVASIQVIGTVQSALSDAVAAQAHGSNLTHIWSLVSGNNARIGQIAQTNESLALSFADVESVTSQSAGQTQTGAGADQLANAFQEALIAQQNSASAHVGQASVTNRIEMEIPWNGLVNPPITQSNSVSAASISTSYSETTQTVVQEASGEGIEWDQNAQQISAVKQGGAASSSAGQSNLENLAGWTGTVATPVTPPVGGGEGGIGTSSVQAGEGLPVVATPLIFGTPPLTLPGLHPGSVHVLGASATRILTPAHGAAGLGEAGTAVPHPAASPTHAPTTPVERFVHTLFNLLGAGSSALVLLLGAMPFAALLALFMIAALGVGRLQYAMPALGRSVDFARRERPG